MMQHKGTVTLESERLILRRFTMDDAEAMFRNWAQDEEVAKYMRWTAHNDISETEEVIADRLKRYEKPNTYIWAIIIKDTNMLVGNIALLCSNEMDMCGEAAYCLGRQYWGQGIITEALRTVIRFGLLEVGFNRIEAYHSINNPASGKVMKNAGMKFEGRMRKKYLSHIGFEDSDLYAILKEDLITENH